MTSFLDLFIGSAQSKYASIAILSAIFIISMAILFNTGMSFGDRIYGILFILYISVFPVALSLFELTCLVNGDANNAYPFCGIYAWIITVMLILYCVVIIFFVLSSMFVYKKAMDKVDVDQAVNQVSKDDAKQVAENMMNMEDNLAPVESSNIAPAPAPESAPAPPAPTTAPAIAAESKKKAEPVSGGEIVGFSDQEFASI